MTNIEKLGAAAKNASYSLCSAGSDTKKQALAAISEALWENRETIKKANALDLEYGKEKGLPESILDRLTLNDTRIKDICQAVIDISRQNDPIGEVLEGSVRPNGLSIKKIRVPLGVVGAIYEARPNVTVDVAALCLKSGNTCLLRGGKEAINSNKETVRIMRSALKKSGLDENCICLVEDTTRESAQEVMKLNKYLSVLIPRGGKGLIKSVVENSTVPVIETGSGNCHVYVDEYADLDIAAKIIYNAKVSRVSVCNSIETILIHENVAKSALPVIKKQLDQKRVVIKGCQRTCEIIDARQATEEDYYTEYLDYILSCKIVKNIDEAIEHITKYSSGHSESIITQSYENSKKFTQTVDSACVYVNASTRFTDGGEFGMGAEVGISTQKLHARGPMGIKALTSVKFIIEGSGQIR